MFTVLLASVPPVQTEDFWRGVFTTITVWMIVQYTRMAYQDIGRLIKEIRRTNASHNEQSIEKRR